MYEAYCYCTTPRSGSGTQRNTGERLSARRRREEEEAHQDDDLALELKSSSDDISKMKRIESARATWRLKEQNKLEESWMSLDMFERHQRGRLSVDLQGELGKFVDYSWVSVQIFSTTNGLCISL